VSFVNAETVLCPLKKKKFLIADYLKALYGPEDPSRILQVLQHALGENRGPDLQQLLELFRCEAGIPDNTGHGMGVYRIMA